MVNINTLKQNFTNYIPLKLSSIAANDPIVSFLSPIISRILTNNINKFEGFIQLLADNEGNIDIENILSEMTTSLVNTNPFTIPVPVIDELVIGNGCIKMGIPFTHRHLVFNQQDIEELKEVLTRQN